jgi:DNA repair protein SbcD/Mre11
VKILHTSDWHLGKVLKGQSRLEEQIAVLADVVSIAQAEQPDLVIVAGDLFDSAAPTAETKKVMVRALTALRRHAGTLVAIAGNHDHGAEFDALRPWADAVGITLRGTVGRAEDHVVTGVTAGGEAWRLAALPFVSQRYAVRASEMFELTAAEATATYADHVARLVAALTEAFADGSATVNLVTAHLTVIGGKLGGGERDAHTIEAYAVPSSVFPFSAHYVALGHLHRRQQVPGPGPVHYCGSPLAIDFGEEENKPSVSIVEVSATTAAKVRPVRIGSALPLRTVRGTLPELADLAETGTDLDRAWLRVYVRERPRAGLREDVQALLPRALEVRLDPQLIPERDQPAEPAARAGHSPRDLFAEYLQAKGIADDAVAALFNRLYEEVAAP